MNYLALCQRTMSEVGISGTMASTTGVVGELLRVKNHVAQAWTEIQTQHEDWLFMRSSYLQGGSFGVRFATVAGQAVYPLGTGPGTAGVTDVERWDETSFRNYVTVAGVQGEIFMDPIGYDQWRDAYMYGALRNVTTRPVALAIGPNFSLNLGPPPMAGYTVEGDYWLPAQGLAVDDDEPRGLPAAHHMAIVYKAIEFYGEYESAAEMISKGERGYARLYSRIESLYAPRVVAGGALA